MRKLSQGEPVKIAADDYNHWQEAGRAHAMSRLNQSQQIVTPDAQEGIVLVKNTLSRAMPRFSVLGLRGSVYNPLYSDQQLTEFKNQIALHGETPSSITSGRFCVLQNDAQPGEVVAGMVSGVTPCRIKVESLTDEFAEIETTTTVDQTRYLKSGGSGSAQILFRPEYTGEQWGVVRLGNRPKGSWLSALTSGVTDGTYTPSSSTDDHTTGFSSLYTFDDDESFELDGSGYIKVNKTINPCIVSGWVTVSMPFRRNNYTYYTARLQFQNPDTLVWSSGGFGDSHTSPWPDVGTLSGGGGNDYYSLHPYTGIGLTEDWKIRLLLTAEYSGTFSPSSIVASATIDIWYQS